MKSQWESVQQLIDALTQRVTFEPLNNEPVIISVEDVKSLLEKISNLEQSNMKIINEVVEAWIPVYRLVKPLTAEGESVSDKAVELIKRQIDQSPPTIPAMEKVIGKLFTIAIGGCNCLTKTPAIEYHDSRCKYRLAFEVAEMLSPFHPRHSKT